MAKFNDKSINKSKMKNRAGGVSYAQPDKLKSDIAELVLTAMLKDDSYYEGETERINRAFKLIKKASEKDPEFVLKAMAYGRNVGYLRSISHVFAVGAISNIKGNPLTKKALVKTFVRPDDAAEVVALWDKRADGKNIPNSLRKAIKYALEHKWDLYQFRKYRMKQSRVSLVDLVNLTHPNPKEWQKTFGQDVDPFELIVKDELPAIETAQTINTATGDDAGDRKDAYMKLIRERKLGYMALLKNLNKILKQASEEEVDEVCKYITDEKLLKNSKVLPKRFIQAWVVVDQISLKRNLKNKVISALEKAFILRSKDVRIVPEGRTMTIVLDTSGSMCGDPLYNGIALAAQLIAIDENAEVYAFATEYKKLERYGLSPFAWISKYFKIDANYASPKFYIGHSTEIRSALRAAMEEEDNYVLVISDMQLYGLYYKYNDMGEMKKDNPNLERIVFWNIEGYGTGTPLKVSKRVIELAGYSDKMVELLPKLMNGHTLVEEIEAYKI